MEIKVKYSKNATLNEDQKILNDFLEKYDFVKTEKLPNRLGSIDLIQGIIISGIARGLINKVLGFNPFVRIGEDLGDSAKSLNQELEACMNWLNSFYEIYISKHLNDDRAISIEERINGITFFVVLNHEKATKELIAELPNAIEKTLRKVFVEKIIDPQSSVIQLFPNFDASRWDYLFMPTYNGFGNFIDRYYDFSKEETIEIKSRKEFYSIFNLENDESHKYIISAKFHEKRLQKYKNN